MRVVETLRERKAMMAELADGFISPPHRRLVQVDDDLEALLAGFDRWITPSNRWGGPPVE